MSTGIRSRCSKCTQLPWVRLVLGVACPPEVFPNHADTIIFLKIEGLTSRWGEILFITIRPISIYPFE